MKRILRRGVRYGKQFLHLPDGFFARLVSTVCNLYGSAFPELKADGNEKYVMESVRYNIRMLRCSRLCSLYRIVIIVKNYF